MDKLSDREIECYLENIPDDFTCSDVDVSDSDNEELDISPLDKEQNNFDSVFFQELEQNIPNPEKELEDDEAVINEPTPSTSTQNPTTPAATKKKKIIEPDRKWKKKDFDEHVPPYNNYEAVNEHFFANCKTATDVFLVFLDEKIIENITFQSNLYATQKGKILNLKDNELLAFIGINFLMGYHKLPSIKNYWAVSEDLHVKTVAEAMTRDRFQDILSYLHVNDNEGVNPVQKDKLCKLRFLIDALNEKFKLLYTGTREVSIDESIILFKGRSSLKQYNPMKPIKRGYKLWCIADQMGYTMAFKVYEGKDDSIAEDFKEYNLGERVVLCLSKFIWKENRIIVFDNFFSSVRLLEKLKMEDTLACGTIRSGRKGNPQNMQSDKSLKRGDWDFRVSNTGIGFYKWHDNKAVCLASNYHGSQATSVLRKQKDGTKLQITCPSVVSDYNKYMGGVDRADRLRALYCVDRKSKKWWHRLFWGFLDIAFVNAFVVYCQMFEKVSVLEFRRLVSQGLISKKNVLTLKRRSKEDPGPSASSAPQKRRKQEYSIPKDVRLSNRGIHWPKFQENRGRCEVCSKKKIQSRPHSMCSYCKVFLCVNEKKNCFSEFHEIDLN